MKYARFIRHGAVHVGVVLDNRVYDLTGASAATRGFRSSLTSLEEIIRCDCDEKTWADLMRVAPEFSHDISEVRLLAPIARPGKILCLALNYAAHAEETNNNRPARPYTFLKPATSVIGPGDPVLRPEGCEQLSYEAELCVVIGRSGRAIRAEDAYHHVFGYTILNDMSARDLGKTDLPRLSVDWYLAKGFDTSAPTGPWVVSRREIPDPHDLDIRLTVNGSVKQQGNTSLMMFKIPEIIEVLSRNVTLEPGDLISTGTPAGATGSVQAGDVIEVTIEGIGTLLNKVVAG